MNDATNTDVNTQTRQTAQQEESQKKYSSANFPVLSQNWCSFVTWAWEVLAIYCFLQKREGASHTVLVIVAALFYAAFPWDLKLFPYPPFSVSLSGCLLPWQPFFLLFSGIKRHQKLSSLPKTTVTRINTPVGLVMNGNDSASVADAQRGVALIRSRLPHRPLAAPHLHCSQHVMFPPGSTVLLPSRQDKLTQTKTIHLRWMPRLPFSIFAFGAAGFCPGNLSLLLTDLNHQPNKATSSLLCFVAYLGVFPCLPTRSTFFSFLLSCFETQ